MLRFDTLPQLLELLNNNRELECAGVAAAAAAAALVGLATEVALRSTVTTRRLSAWPLRWLS